MVRPRLKERPCPACGKPVEPLRAGAVVLLEDGMRFLCDAYCRERFLAGERARTGPARPPSQAEAQSAGGSAPGPATAWATRPALARGAALSGGGSHSPASASPASDSPASASPASASPASDSPASASPASDARRRRPLLFGFVVSLAGVGLGLLALRFSWVALPAAACALLGAAAAGWSGKATSAGQDLFWALPPLGVTVAVVGGLVAGPGASWWFMTGACLAAAAVVGRASLDANARAPVDALVARLRARLPTRVRVAVPASEGDLDMNAQETDAERVRAGEEVLVLEGEVLAVDGVVQAGEASVLLHPSATAPVQRQAGDPVLAGARVVEGTVRVLATRTGDDRALVLPARFGDRDAEGGMGMSTARLTAWIGLALTLALVAGLFLAGSALATQLSVVASILLAVPLLAVRRASRTPLVAGGAAAVERGIAFQTDHALDRAGKVTVVALSMHGTLTEGVFDLVEMHPVGDVELDQLASLVAGAESAAEDHPLALAALRYCERRSVAPASVRRAAFVPGRGVTAVAPRGEVLVVGNRQLLLDEGVSVAVADTAAVRAEDRGRTAIFVGLDGRLRAVLSFEDAQRLGARAAVQRLIDLGLEVVLVSGDHRGTAEVVAQRLGIGHVKAELLPDERGAEVARLTETGGLVATVGRPHEDDATLASADVPIVLGAAGAPLADKAIALTGDDPRDAAAALWLARATRDATVRGVWGGCSLGLVLLLLCAAGWVPPAAAGWLGLAVEAYASRAAARLLLRVERRLPARG